MNCTELKLARTRRKIPGRAAAVALGLTVDGYYKKEHGDAEVYVSDAFALTHLFELSFSEFTGPKYEVLRPGCSPSGSRAGQGAL